MGKAAGATLTLIPEEFAGRRVRLKTIVDTLVGAIIKRLSYGRPYGVAVMAEGLVLDIEPEDLAALHEVERDAHGHLRIDEVNIGEILKTEVQRRLRDFSIRRRSPRRTSITAAAPIRSRWTWSTHGISATAPRSICSPAGTP
jgi:6-phosphofructokinase 1